MKQTISIIVPFYNEEKGISQFKRHSERLELGLKKNYEYEFILVNDGSKDSTKEKLKKEFGKNKKYIIISYDKNKGLGGALKEGFKKAKGNLIANIDSDCTYEPVLVLEMLKLLKENDIVTASPYHPKGTVEGVPEYRLILSKGISFLYRILVYWNMHTFTAMFRIYRKEVLEETNPADNGFLYVTKLMVYSLIKGKKAVEFPTVLRVRKYGQSSMKIINVIKQHLKFIFKVFLIRFKLSKMN